MTTRVNGQIETGAWLGKQHMHFEIDFGADVSAKFGAGSAVEAVIFTAQTVGTIVAIGSAQGTVVRVMYEGEDMISAADLEALVQGLGTVDAVNLSAATVAEFVY